MTGEHLTDIETQQFALERPGNDPQAAAHIYICTKCREKVESYQLLFTGLKEQPSPAFDFDLEQLVMQQLQPVKQARDQAIHWLIAIGVVFAGIIVLLFRDYLTIANWLLVVLTVISTLPVLLFLCAETFRTYKRKMRILEI